MTLREKCRRKSCSFSGTASEGKIPDTPKKGNPLFDRVENIIIGSNRIATEAARKKAQRLGYEPVVLTTELQGEARDAAPLALPPGPGVAVLPGLRPQKDLPHRRGRNDGDRSGQGSRRSEYGNGPCLRHGHRGDLGDHVSLGRHRRDGRPHRCRRRLRRRETIPKARALGLDAQSFLDDNDSYHFFEKAGGLFKTGPTGTNVMDLQIILIE